LKRLLIFFATIALTVAPIVAQPAHAAAGIFASGGGSVTVGDKFTVTVKASGTEFDSLQGAISVSGPASVVSFTAGGATWLPGKTPANGQQFVGIVSKTSSLTVATITLKATGEGSGSVNVSGVKLAKTGQIVATDAGGAGFTVKRAPQLPGQIKVSSSTHPDQGQVYEARTINVSWDKPNGVTEFSYLLDQSAGTTPGTKATGSGTSAAYENKDVGTYYFHIRGKNGDGWGSTTHFKIAIKEPDPKINETLTKPVIQKAVKHATFATNIDEGTLTGIMINGTAEPSYKVVLTATPSLGDVPAEKLTTTADETGAWQILLDVPVRAGFYKLTVQGMQDKILTPVSEAIRLELSIAKGGYVGFITEKDVVPTPMPSPTPSPAVTVKGARTPAMSLLWGALFALVATGVVWAVVRMRRQ
jgi:hypothetical protein